MDPQRLLLRHTVATVAYRAAKAVRGADQAFASFRVAPSSRTPAQILAHMGDLFDWALALADGKQAWSDSKIQEWNDEVARFFDTLHRFDARLADDRPLACDAGQLFQGPIADALTHVGQLTMLRRIAGQAIRGENYYKADIATGSVGLEQAPPRREFD